MDGIYLGWRGGGIHIGDRHTGLSAIGTGLDTQLVFKCHHKVHHTAVQMVVGGKGERDIRPCAEGAFTGNAQPWRRRNTQIDTVIDMVLAARLRNIHLIPAIGGAMGDEDIRFGGGGVETVGTFPFIIEDVAHLQGMNLNGRTLTGGGGLQTSIKPCLLQIRQRIGIKVHMEISTTIINNLTRIELTGGHGNIDKTSDLIRAQQRALTVCFTI